MASDAPSPQRIAHLTPLSDVLARLDALDPVEAAMVETGAAGGAILAQDCTCPDAVPPRPLALRDGWAVRAEWTADASSYAPAIPGTMPSRIEVGEPLPAAADAVLPPEHLALTGGRAEILAAIAAFDGVLQAGGDVARAQILRRAGERLRNSDIALLQAAGFARVAVRRPRMRIVALARPDDPFIGAAAALLMSAIENDGGAAALDHREKDTFAFDPAPAADHDAVIVIGGTGTGRQDRSVTGLPPGAGLVAHGIALSPGETAAVAILGRVPLLMFPGRIDAVSACWLALGRPLLARLGGRAESCPAAPAALTRKVSSTIGVTDFVLVRRDGAIAEPLAARYWPLQAMARANGFVVVPAGSEGFPAGMSVSVSDWP